MSTDETRIRRWTRAEYENLIALGVFQPGEAIELLGGDLVVAEPQGAAHYTAICKSARALDAAFGPGWIVRTQGPIGLDDQSEPEPDVAVVPGRIEDYRLVHPSRPVLILEVADSSLAVDRERKGSLYARAGIADYWVLNLIDRVLEVYREPAPDARAVYGRRYSRSVVLTSPARIAPLAAPQALVAVVDLLP